MDRDAPNRRLSKTNSQPMQTVSVKNGANKPLKAQKSLKYFQHVNRALMERTLSSLSNEQKAVVNLVPLLFHVNSPELPGYVSADTPFGIRYFFPEKQHQDAANIVLGSYQVQRRALLHYPIASVFLMGSSSSIAFSKSSDFDVWICPEPGMSDDQRALLEQKGLAITNWAETYRLEVHFFLVSADQFKKGQLDDLSKESSGSAQRFMLLEEFYRSSIHIAGLFPLWWVVPSEYEHSYYDFIDKQVARRNIDLSEFIDLGPLPEIPTEEYYGAGLWQTSKGINSPHKSILKILLMESYTEDYPEVDLLSQRYKTLIQSGTTALEHLDPYILMYQKVEEYLQSTEQLDRLEVARMCFYLKVNPQLSSNLTAQRAAERQSLLSEMVEKWRWDMEKITVLDRHSGWKVDQAAIEQRTLIKELMNSFKRLSAFSRVQADSKYITDEDMNTLARKLYAAFERKPGKIAIVNRDATQMMLEPFCLLEQRLSNSGQKLWKIYRISSQSQANNERVMLFRSPNVTEILTWGHLNGVLSPKSYFNVSSPDTNFDVNEARNILAVLHDIMPRKSATQSDVESFNHTARTVKSSVFINVGLDPFKRYTNQGVQIASNKSDPLCYANAGINLVQRIDHVYTNSWGETYCTLFEGEDAAAKFLQHYFSQAMIAKKGVIPSEFHCFSSGRGRIIAQRMNQLVASVFQVFLPKGVNRAARFIFELGNTQCATQLKGRELMYQLFPSREHLFAELSQPSPKFRPTLFDKKSNLVSPLHNIFATNQRGKIQFFFIEESDGIGVYGIDENGSSFYSQSNSDNIESIQRQYFVFCTNIVRRINMRIDSAPDNSINASKLEFYRVLRARNGGYVCKRTRADLLDENKTYFEISVYGDYLSGDHSLLTIFCDGEEFSAASCEADVLEEVARHIFNKRKGGDTYPIYITDLDIAEQFSQTSTENPMQSIRYLKLKLLIEKQLNSSIGLLR